MWIWIELELQFLELRIIEIKMIDIMFRVPF